MMKILLLVRAWIVNGYDLLH